MYMSYEKSDERISFLCQHSESWKDECVTVYKIQFHVLVCRRRGSAKASASFWSSSDDRKYLLNFRGEQVVSLPEAPTSDFRGTFEDCESESSPKGSSYRELSISKILQYGFSGRLHRLNPLLHT